MRLEPVSALARSLGCVCREQAPLAGCTSFKIGGPAALLVDAPNPAALQRLLGCCREEEIPVLFLGNGSNVLEMCIRDRFKGDNRQAAFEMAADILCAAA